MHFLVKKTKTECHQYFNTSFFLSKVFNTSLAEPAPAGYEDVANVVPPYSAFSAKGRPEVCAGTVTVQKHQCRKNLDKFPHALVCHSLQGDLVYVNYGRTEDFFQLEREMGVNVTGRIVIVRYGKIFRGNKV